MGLAVNRSYRRLVFLFLAAHHDLRVIVRAQVVISSATIAGLTPVALLALALMLS